MPLNAHVAWIGLLFGALSPALVVTAPLWLWWLARQRRLRREQGWQQLWPFMARTLERCSEVMIEPDGVVPLARVPRAIDAYLHSARASRRIWRVKVLLAAVELHPLLHLRRPLSLQSSTARRRFVGRRLWASRGLAGVLAKVRQLVRMGYYAAPEARHDLGLVPARRTVRVGEPAGEVVA
jgi:hypothetical protein